MKVKPLVFTKQYSQWVAMTPFGTRVYMYGSAVYDGQWYWEYEEHKQDSYPPEKVRTRCKNRDEAERQANAWFVCLVMSCLEGAE